MNCQAGYDELESIIFNKLPVIKGVWRDCPLKAHTHACIAFNEGLICQLNHIHQLYVYVDGGFLNGHENHTTRSVAFVYEDHYGTQEIVLSAGGRVTFDQHSPVVLGECAPSSSFTAELFAQVVARILILQYAHYSIRHYANIPICIVYDTESASAATAFSKIPKTQKSSGLLGNILDALCKEAYTRTSHHAYSHECQPYDDYVDSICTHMRDRLVPCELRIRPLTYSTIRSIDLFVGSRSPIVSSQIFREEQVEVSYGVETLYDIPIPLSHMPLITIPPTHHAILPRRVPLLNVMILVVLNFQM